MSNPGHTENARILVRRMLESAPAYGAMLQHERQDLARKLVDVMAYLTDPYAHLSGAAPQAMALEDVNAALKGRLSAKQDFAGKDFKAGASQQGAQVFKELVAAVDFPKFVAGLIDGVYNSIVRSSIQQMQAYGKMLEGIVKSVDQFAKENISPDEARQFVKKSFPDSVDVDPESGKLTAKGDEGGDRPAPDFRAVLEMQENVALSEENEEKIVLAAQIKMARQRQQLLAQMVAMGINRIIVTDGEIKASVLFDMKAKDTAQRTTQAAVSDSRTRTESTDAGIGGWFSGGDETVTTTVSSAYSAEQEKSESMLETKAKLSGSVTVKFKSETFPLERLASADERGAVQQKSAR
jgi:hypothetical protein